jgi:hypothetical protein
MWDLLSHATPEELRVLAERIECVTIPEMPSPYAPLPMTTTPPLFTDIDKMVWRTRYGL